MTTDELPPEVQKYIGRLSSFMEGPDEVNKPMIRHWCEMVEDANPLYTDEEYAKNSEYGGIISPPTMLTTWVYPRWWPPLPLDEMDPAIGPAQLDVPLGDVPFFAASSITGEYLLPMRPGDKIRYQTELHSISPFKKIRIGAGHFVTTIHYYYNQRDELVGTTEFVLFRYRMEE